MTMRPEEVRLGIYRHYKGPLYQVIGLAHDANADTLWAVPDDSNYGDGSGDCAKLIRERTVVVYVPLQLDGAHFGPRMAVRTLEDFTGWADVSDEQWREIDKMNSRHQRNSWPGIGLGARDSQGVAKRFTYLGQLYAPGMSDTGETA